MIILLPLKAEVKVTDITVSYSIKTSYLLSSILKSQSRVFEKMDCKQMKRNRIQVEN